MTYAIHAPINIHRGHPSPHRLRVNETLVIFQLIGLNLNSDSTIRKTQGTRVWSEIWWPSNLTWKPFRLYSSSDVDYVRTWILQYSCYLITDERLWIILHRKDDGGSKRTMSTIPHLRRGNSPQLHPPPLLPRQPSTFSLPLSPHPLMLLNLNTHQTIKKKAPLCSSQRKPEHLNLASQWCIYTY